MRPRAIKVFISYARADGAQLAQQLHDELAQRGYQPWLDVQRLKGGASWAREIEVALDEADVVVALLSNGSHRSEICRAEQLRSLRKGVCVIPMLVRPGVDVPLYLEVRQYIDSTAPAAMEQLVASIRERDGSRLSEPYRQTYVTAPPLPPHLVARPGTLDAVRRAVMEEGDVNQIALTALSGMGGIGKTVLAKVICHDPIIQDAFPDGVIWLTIGRESRLDPIARMREVAKALKDDLSRYDTLDACRGQFQTTILNKAALIVLDDVWSVTDLEPFQAKSQRSRLLFTTRDGSIGHAAGARTVTADLPTEDEARGIMATWCNKPAGELPPEAGALIRECGRLPLAVAIVGAMLRDAPLGFWRSVLDRLRNADLAKLQAQFPDYPHTDLVRAMQVSVDSLTVDERTRYLALAVLVEDMPAAPAMLRTLWNTDDFDAFQTAAQLVRRSLAEREDDAGAIRLHDLQLDYVRAQHEDRRALTVVHDAMRLSAHALASDPAQFGSQMRGRLIETPPSDWITSFLNRIQEASPRPWLRPLRATLLQSGGPLVRIINAHAGPVLSVALTGDGRRAVSSGPESALKLWDVDTGRHLWTLRAHTAAFFCVVAIDDQGRVAVSGEADGSLKVWDLERRLEISTLSGHSHSARDVSVSADGRRAVSVGYDRALKVWDLDTSELLHTFEVYFEGDYVLAVNANGTRAVSASHVNAVKLWDLETWREQISLPSKERNVKCVAISADGKQVVAGEYASVVLWNAETGRRDLAFTLGSQASSVAVSSGTGRVFAASRLGELRVWNAFTGTDVCLPQTHEGGVMDIAVSRDGHVLVSGGDDGTLRVWRPDRETTRGSTRDHPNVVMDVAADEAGKVGLSASLDGLVHVWDLKTARILRSWNVDATQPAPRQVRFDSSLVDVPPPVWWGRREFLRGAAVSADGSLAAIGVSDGTLQIWRIATGELALRLSGHSGAVLGAVIRADNEIAISASEDHTLRAWRLEDGGVMHTFSGHTDYVSRVILDRDGLRALSASRDCTIRLWDVASGKELVTLTGHRHWVMDVLVSADGRRTISSSRDRTVRIWDLMTGSEIGVLRGHTDSVRGLALHPGGRFVASTSRDRSLKLWDLETGANVATFRFDVAPHRCVFVDPHTVIAGDEGGAVHFFFLEL